MSARDTLKVSLTPSDDGDLVVANDRGAEDGPDEVHDHVCFGLVVLSDDGLRGGEVGAAVDPLSVREQMEDMTEVTGELSIEGRSGTGSLCQSDKDHP